MRVTTLGFSNQMLSSFGRNSNQLNKLMMQINVQKRIITPSDDPAANAQLVQIRRDQAGIAQFGSNIDRLSGSLAQQETLVKGSGNELLSVYDHLREANNSFLSPADRQAYATTICSNLQSLVALVNSKDEDGRYLFSGTLTDRVPLAQDASGQWQFNGNHQSIATPVANGVCVDSGLDLSAVLGNNVSLLNDLQSLLAKMDDATLAPADYAVEMTTMIDRMNQAHGDSAALLTELGGRQNILSLMRTTHEDNHDINETTLGELQGLDMAQAFTRLGNYRMATQTAYQSYLKIANLSLFALD